MGIFMGKIIGNMGSEKKKQKKRLQNVTFSKSVRIIV